MKESLQDNLHPSKPNPSKPNPSKPNKRESQIGQILTDAKIKFKFHRSVDYQTLQNEYRKKEVDIFIRPKKLLNTMEHTITLILENTNQMI